MIFRELIKEKYLEGFTAEEKKSLYACADFYGNLVTPTPDKVLQPPQEIQYIPNEMIYRPAEVEFKYALNRLKMKDPSYISAYFSNAHLGDEKVKTFVKAIPEGSPCSYFFFGNCDMTEKGVQAVVHALYKKEVSFLDVSSNPFGAVGGRAIAAALKTAAWREVRMYNTQVPLEVSKSFEHALSCREMKRDGVLSRFSIEFNVPREKTFLARGIQRDLSHRVRLLSAPLLTDVERARLSGGKSFERS